MANSLLPPSLPPSLPPALAFPFLIVASRNVAFLTYIDCASFEKTNVSLNNALWDEHVSFAVLSLAVSPCQQFVLAATGTSLPPSLPPSRPPSLPPSVSSQLISFFY